MKAFREFSKLLASAKTQVEELELSKTELKIAKAETKIWNKFGGIFALFGFGFWYFRVQKPLDKKLKLELQVAERAAALEAPPN